MLVSLMLGAASAGAVTIGASDQGRFTSVSTSGGVGSGTTLVHNPGDTSLSFFSPLFTPPSFSTSGYLIFDLATAGGTVTTASIELDVSSVVCTFCGTFNIGFQEVSSDPALFQSAYDEASNPLFFKPPLGVGYDIFLDIANGPVNGSIGVTAAGTYSIVLDAAAIAAINAASGGLYVLGMTVFGSEGTLVASTGSLNLTIPEPGLAIVTLVGLVLVTRTQRRQA